MHQTECLILGFVHFLVTNLLAPKHVIGVSHTLNSRSSSRIPFARQLFPHFISFYELILFRIASLEILVSPCSSSSASLYPTTVDFRRNHQHLTQQFDFHGLIALINHLCLVFEDSSVFFTEAWIRTWPWCGIFDIVFFGL